MKKRKHLLLSAALLASALLTAGCGGSGSTDSYSMDTASTSASYDSGGGWSEADVEEKAAMNTEASPSQSTSTADETGSSAVIPDLSQSDISNRKLIKNVSLSLETENFDTMKSNMEESISSFGGYVEYSSYSAPQTEYMSRFYSLTARIPSEKLDEFVAVAGNLGTLVNKSESVTDVTLDYVDKTAYKESLQVEYERVTELLEKAEDLEQVLALESKLSQLRYEINSYESQLRTYDNLIDYSTVDIYITEVERETEISNTVGSRISNGFISSLYSVRDFFVTLFVFLIGNLPVILVLAVIVVLIVLLARRIYRRKRAKKQKKYGESSSHYAYDENARNTGNRDDVPEKTEKSQDSSHED